MTRYKHLSLLFMLFTSTLYGKNLALSKFYPSLVKIKTTQKSYSYVFPWQAPRQNQSTGSGFVIEGNKILTNAHVVSGASYIEVILGNQAEPFVATLEHIAHDCDLAILSVANKTFHQHSNPLAIGDLASIQSKVYALGYPAGGNEISVTKGIISRIEVGTYTHSGYKLLLAQTDAAINPGNSGGPVVSEQGVVVGVAFQGNTQLQNTGYIIPTPIIKHFLKDVSKGSYTGFPVIPASTQLLKSAFLKKHYGLNENENGILINEMPPTTKLGNYLNIDDVIYHIEGQDIDYEGNVPLIRDTKVNASYLITQKQIGETTRLGIIRQGKRLDINVPFNDRAIDIRLVPTTRYEEKPRYMIFSGFVFQDLTQNYLQEWGEKWYYHANNKLLYLYHNGKKLSQDHEVVVLTNVLLDQLNHGYHDSGLKIVTEVNGTKVENLKHVAELVDHSQLNEITIMFDDHSKVIIDRKKSKKEQPRLLNKYAIEQSRYL